jgi:methylmalonyl-CoA/ethylmalonyl-CoA epimerase
LLKKILHIGIVVKDLERAIEKFKSFGLQCTDVRELKELKIKIAFFSAGGSQLELIQFLSDEQKRTTIVGSQVGAINHLCFEVDDLEATIGDFEKKGAKMVPGYPKKGAHGRVAFFYPETTEDVLIEICAV